MKIKENYNISISKFPLVFIISSVLGIIIRTVQMLKYIDSSTGFYTGGSFLTVLLNAVLFASILYYIVGSFLSKESANVSIGGKKDKSVFALGVVFAVSLLGDSISGFLSSTDAMVYSSEINGQFRSLMTSGVLPEAMRGVFAFFSAIYILFFSLAYKNGSYNASKYKILAVAPVFWCGCKILTLFMEEISYVEVSDLFYGLILIALMIMFFMSLAQVASGVYSEEMRWRITGFGFSAALVSVVTNVPKFVLQFINGGALINEKYPFSFVDFVFAIFAFLVCLSLAKSCKKESE